MVERTLGNVLISEYFKIVNNFETVQTVKDKYVECLQVMVLMSQTCEFVSFRNKVYLQLSEINTSTSFCNLIV